jgi:hypothetical protein
MKISWVRRKLAFFILRIIDSSSCGTFYGSRIVAKFDNATM